MGFCLFVFGLGLFFCGFFGCFHSILFCCGTYNFRFLTKHLVNWIIWVPKGLHVLGFDTDRLSFSKGAMLLWGDGRQVYPKSLLNFSQQVVEAQTLIQGQEIPPSRSLRRQVPGFFYVSFPWFPPLRPPDAVVLAQERLSPVSVGGLETS